MERACRGPGACLRARSHARRRATTRREAPICRAEPAPGRRELLAGSAAAAAGGVVAGPARAGSGSDQEFLQLWPPFFEPYVGVGSRKTLLEELVPGEVWSLTQAQTLGPLSTPLRCTVVKLASSGGLWVHAPLAPTAEFFRLVESVGTVEHVVLSTFALEHKVYVAPASKRWPKAQVWVTPAQWSFPLPLPLPLLGIHPTGVLGESGPEPDWAPELPYETILVEAGVGPAVETTFFHRASKSLICTDVVQYIPREPPPIADPALLLKVAADDPADAPLPDTPENRRIGWAKTCLLVSFFGPDHTRPAKPGGLDLIWEPGYEESFDAISEKLIVSPVVRFLVFGKNPAAVRSWLDRVDKWDYQRVIPAHFSVVPATREELRAAFRFLDDPKDPSLNPLPAGDIATIAGLNAALEQAGVANTA